MYANHIFLVAGEAKRLSERFGWDSNLAIAGALLHDIADATMSRFDSNHEQETKQIAQELLTGAWFSESEISIIVHDVIEFHSCRNQKYPQTIEWKVMATADAIVHFTSDFYEHAIQQKQKNMLPQEIRKWALPKIERDFFEKIFFEEIRKEIREEYEKAKEFFTKLQ